MYMPAGYEDSDYSDSEYDFCNGESKPERKTYSPSPWAVASQEESGEDKLYKAATEGNLEEVRQLLQEHSRLATASLRYGWPVLLIACSDAQPEIVRYMLEEKRVDVNESWDLKTALLTACESSQSSERVLKVVNQLLEFGAVINCRDRFGKTPLMFAIENGHTEVVKLIIDQASLEATDNEGLTSLFHAVICNQPEIVQLLLKAGAMIDIVNRRGFTPRQEAEFRGFAEIVELFPVEENYIIPKKYMSYSHYRDIAHDDREDEMPGYYPEIGLLLCGMYSNRHLEIFAKENFNLLRFLTLDDLQLKELGLALPFERKKILLGLHKFHQRAWKNQSMLKFKNNHKLDSYDVFQVLCNHLKQTTVVQASLIYVTKMMPPVDMKNEFETELEQCVEALCSLQRTVVSFQKEMERIHALTAVKSVLHVEADRIETPRRCRSLVRTALKLALLSGAVSFVVYLRMKKH